MGDTQLVIAEAREDSVGGMAPPAGDKPVPKIAVATARPRNTLTPFLRDWHRRAGLFAFLFMGWLGLSGILINQSPSWGYDTDRIYWEPVMWLYSLKPEPPTTGWGAGEHWLAVTPEGTVLNAKAVTPPVKLPLGLVAGGTEQEPLLFIANAEAIVVVTLDGARYDELRSPILPVSVVRRIGSVIDVPGSIAVQDLDAFQSLDGGSTWTAVDPAKVQWSAEVELPAAERDRLLPFSRPYVTLEHVLVDAHSGAIFGRAGVYVINTVGVAAIFLSITGVWMWWRMSRRRNVSR